MCTVEENQTILVCPLTEKKGKQITTLFLAYQSVEFYVFL